jgi:hypothetical protein
MRTRRLILPFFSIPVTEAWPISPVRATCVETQDRLKANDVILLRDRSLASPQSGPPYDYGLWRIRVNAGAHVTTM